MADILVRGMEMPKTCGDCPLSALRMDCKLTGRDISHDWIKRKIPDWCPLVPLPEGHGRLGDLDRLFEVMGQDADRWLVDEVSMIETDDVLDAIQNAPTIVPAEGGTDE